MAAAKRTSRSISTSSAPFSICSSMPIIPSQRTDSASSWTRLARKLNWSTGASASQVHSWAQLKRERGRELDSLDLINILRLIQRTDTTDERGKVYSILGLPKERDRAGIHIQYSHDQSVSQVRTDLAKYCISAHLHNGIIQICPIRLVKGMICRAGYQTGSHHPRDPRHLTNTQAIQTPKGSLSQDNKKIILQGYIFDKTAVLGVPVMCLSTAMEGPTENDATAVTQSTHPHWQSISMNRKGTCG
jgi:hypothetical protein